MASIVYTWDASFNSSPAGSQSIRLGDDRIRDTRAAIDERAQREHYWGNDDTNAYHGRHKPGSSRAYYTDTEPTVAPDGDTLGSLDTGRLWVGQTTKAIKFWTGSAFEGLEPGFNVLDSATSIQDTDIVAIYDGSASGHRQMTVSNLRETLFPRSMVVLESSDSSWSIPDGVKVLKVTAVGGGGGGGNTTSSANSAAGGGGAGGVSIAVVDVSETSALNVTVGSGGTAASAGDSSTVVMGTNTVVSAGGGAAGSTAGGTIQGGGLGGVSSQGDMNVPGGAGFVGVIVGSVGAGGQGGSNMYGAGAYPDVSGGNRNGLTGNGYGAGGSGAHCITASARSGGAGTDGVVIIEY